MGLIPIDKIKEGMVTASDVLDPFGRTLLHSGQVLQSRHIEIFKSYGLEEISISGIDTIEFKEKMEFDSDVYFKASQELEQIFILTDRSWEIMKEIFYYAVLKKAHRDSTKEHS